MIDILAILTKSLTVKNAVKGLIIEPLQKVFSKLDEHDYADVIELSAFWKRGEVPYGTIVNLQGVFSEYSHTYLPHTYTAYIPVGVSHSMDNPIVGRIGWRSEVFQPPVETVPEVDLDGKKIQIRLHLS